MEFNLNEEIRCGYTVTPEMKKVWAVQMDLALKLLEVCEKYNLKCWADCGTLLGAVRHKGFIPWDDDIDMIMFREDYDKLLEVGEKEFNHPYFLQHYNNEKDFYRPYARLRNSDTTAIVQWETKEFDFHFNQGIFIDIFVMDNVPDDKKEMEKFGKKVERLTKWNLNISRIHHSSILGKGLSIFLKMIFKTPGKLTEYRIKTIQKYNNTECKNVVHLCFGYAPHRVREKAWFNETVMLPFENIELPCPAGYDAELTRIYGDYMTPVKAPTAHGEVFFDTEKPYTEYLKK